MGKKIQKYIAIFILAVTSPIWVPLILLGNLIAGRAKLKPEEVLEVLERMKTGEIDQYWYEDFLSIPIKNDLLDEIRNECGEIYTEKSPYLSKTENGEFYVNDFGKELIQKLIEKCKAHSA